MPKIIFRIITTCAFLFLTTALANAQKYSITGTVCDNETQEKLGRATIQLLSPDSAYVSGGITDVNGVFNLNIKNEGKYMVKVSYLGMLPVLRNVELTSKTPKAELGIIKMSSNSIILKETVITSTVPKVVVVEDTFIYNSAAYRIPEGSAVEALIERLPGAKIDDDGKITINGKEVKKIKLDGREFMLNDTKTAMKNLPAAIIDKVKAYDEKSDMAKLTGIDDGEETTVLDFNVKRGMNRGMFSNINAAYGTDDRYSGRVMLSRFSGDLRHVVMGNANNTNNMGFGGRRGRSGGRSGLQASKSGSVNISYEKRRKLKVDGTVQWNHSGSDNTSKTFSENFVNRTGAFSNSHNTSRNRNDNWNGNMRIEWRPDTLRTINFRPNFSVGYNDGLSRNASASYNEDPYLFVTDPLASENLALLAKDSIAVNSRSNKSLNYGRNHNLGATLQYHRRFGSKGRNLGLSASINTSSSHSKSVSASNVHLYKLKDRFGNDSTYQTNRHNVTPSSNWSYSLQATYTEPIIKNTFLQFDYSFRFNHNQSERSTFNFDQLNYDDFDNVMTHYRDWESFFGYVDGPIEDYLDRELSRYSEYNNYTHNINVQLRVVREKYNMNAGVMIQPQRSYFTQDYRGRFVDTVRNVTNISPTLNFRYRFDRRTNLRITYRGSTQQPSISQMLDITDNSNPLNISKGNPGLKPSFTSRINVNYQGYKERYKRTIQANASFSTTQNSISNKVTYDEATGGRTTQPENINGNWSANGGFNLNTALDTMGIWNLSSSTSASYNHRVSYLTLNRSSDSEKNYTKSTNISQSLTASYRNSWLEIETIGNVNYSHTRNMLRSTGNMDTWRFSYGLNIELTAPWGTSLSSEIFNHGRRGYSDATLNTDELIWNMQISHGFLRGKPLTVSLQMFDILKEQSNINSTANANRRSDTETNGINSYAMLTVNYRMNLFGTREARRGMRQAGREREMGEGGQRGGGGMRGGRGRGR
ncbi:MAG: outer membrane beta-barrel protein [Prevotella sp.]|nr:outer membrane beta-barrel protein [Prevotella sp.]